MVTADPELDESARKRVDVYPYAISDKGFEQPEEFTVHVKFTFLSLTVISTFR